MLELRTQMSVKEIEAEGSPFVVYSLTSILPFEKSLALPVNLNFLVDASLFPGGDALCSLLSGLVSGLDGGSSFSVTMLKEDARIVLSNDLVAVNSPKISNAFRDQSSKNAQTDAPFTVSPRIVLEGLKLAASEARKNAGANKVNRIVYLARRGTHVESDEDAGSLISFVTSIKSSSPGAPSVAVDVYATGKSINENLLIDMAECSGGRYRYVGETARLGNVLKVDALRLSKSSVKDFTLSLTLYRDVVLRRAYSVGYGIKRLYDSDLNRDAPVEMEPGGPVSHTLFLGDVEPNALSAVFLEILAPVRPPGRVRLGLMVGECFMPGAGGMSESTQLIVTYKKGSERTKVPLPVSKMVAQCASLRLFQQAEYLILTGQNEKGMILINNAVEILRRAGNRKAFEIVKKIAGKADGVDMRSAENPANEEASEFDFMENRDLLFAVRSQLMQLGLRRE